MRTDRFTLLALAALLVTSSGCRRKKKIDDETLSLAVGARHACVLMTDKGVRCWGANDEGQLGNVSREPHPIPARLSGTTQRYASLEAGGTLTCALTSDQRVECWGSERHATSHGEEPIPIDVSALKDVEQLAIGGNHGCARLEQGAVRCFGANDYGQLGVGHTNRVTGVADVVGLWGVTGIAAGKEHTCALVTDGSIKCWGRNQEGQLGDGTTKDSATPVNVVGIAGAQAIACGGGHTCALLAGGSVRCWGRNDQGELGDGTRVRKPTPTAVAGLEEQIGISAGDSDTCSWGKDAAVRCWGANDQSQMADGTHDPRLSPHKIVGFSGQTMMVVPEEPFAITDVKMGDGFTCVRATDKRVRCWGKNDVGQCGDGTRDVRPVPVPVKLASAPAG